LFSKVVSDENQKEIIFRISFSKVLKFDSGGGRAVVAAVAALAAGRWRRRH